MVVSSIFATVAKTWVSGYFSAFGFLQVSTDQQATTTEPMDQSTHRRCKM
jgi:hypothetical protein